MKRIAIILVAITLMASSCAREPQRPYTVEQPRYMFGFPDMLPPKTPAITLNSVSVSDSSTVLRFTNYTLSQPGLGIRISDHTSLVAGGRLYPLRAMEGVQGNDYIVNRDTIPQRMITDYALIFDPIPEGVRKVSLLEGHFALGFHFINIELY